MRPFWTLPPPGLIVAHEDKEAAGGDRTWKRTLGFHPMLCFLERPRHLRWGGVG